MILGALISHNEFLGGYRGFRDFLPRNLLIVAIAIVDAHGQWQEPSEAQQKSVSVTPRLQRPGD